MSTTFHEVVVWLMNDASDEEKKTLNVLLQTIQPKPRLAPFASKHGTSPMEREMEALADSASTVMMSATPPKQKMNAAQTKARMENLKKAREARWAEPKKKKKRRASTHTGTAGRVWQAMQQSSGQLDTNELAQILGLQRVQVASALNGLYGRHSSVLKRTWVKGGWDTVTDTRKPGFYLYQYTGKAAETNGVRHG